MKKLSCVLLLTCLAGCPSAPPKAQVTTAQAQSNNARRIGLELLRLAPDTARTWEGLQLLNSERSQQPARLGKQLQETVGLSDAELQDISAPNFQHADAYHVAECFLLRNLAHSLEVGGAAPAELARQAFQWVQRHVLLHEQGDDWLPPAEVLRRGFGSQADQARVFLALAQQLHLFGGVIVLPDAPDAVRLVAVLPAKSTSDSAFLFDARRGLPLFTTDGKVATAKDVQVDPKLLDPAGLTPEQWRTALVRVACPLEALSPRMDDLQSVLSMLEGVHLHVAPAELIAKLRTATDLNVRVWNAAPVAGKTANSPTRALRLFLPREEGGVDAADRQKRFRAELVPVTAALLALDGLGLGKQLSETEQRPLRTMVLEMFEKYDLEPRRMVLHGKGEEAVQRYERLRTFLEDENLTGLSDSPDFPREVADWRAKLHAAYLALAAKDPEGQLRVNSLWVEDQYLLTLLHVDGEDRLATPLGRGDERIAPPKKTALTAIVAFVTRDYLQQRALWTRAQVWHDKAEREQLRAAHATPGHAAAAARSAWLNTRSAWNLYLDRSTASPTIRQARVQGLHALLKQNDTRLARYATHVLERLHLELHQHYAARINRARAMALTDGAKAAAAELAKVDEEITTLLEKGRSGQSGLQGELDETIQALRGANQSAAIHSLELMANDWTPQGYFHWLREQARAQLKRL